MRRPSPLRTALDAESPSRPPAAAQELLEAVGHTPLLRLSRVAAHLPHVELWAKAEHLNPGGSVKDRAARAMLLEGLRGGRLRPGRTILEATSGNTGIALAMLGAALGHEVRLCLPANASAERQGILRAYGARLELTDPLEGTDGAIRRARELAAASPERFFYPDQYANDANWRAHARTTGPEIVAQTGGRVTHFVAGLGTSGTFVGTARFLRSLRPPARCVALEPDGPLHGLEGMKHMASALVPPIWDPALADARLEIATEEAYAMTRRLAREEGLFVGPSSGANVVGALAVAGALPVGSRAVVVTVLPDGGSRYLSQHFWAPGVALLGETAAAIREHARRSYPEECCGVLLGEDGAGGARVAAAVTIENARGEERRRRFLVRPQDYLEAERAAERRGLALLGFYHSHPDHPACPSAFDLAHAWPNLHYLIVAVAGGEPGEMTAWALREDRSAFVPETLDLAT